MNYTLNFEANRYQHFLLHNWEGCRISAWRQVNMTEVLCDFTYSLHARSGILSHNPTICMEGLSQYSVASIQSRLWTRWPGFQFLAEASCIFSIMSRQALGPAQPHKVYQGFFPLESSNHGVKFTTHLQLVSRLRMCGAVPLLPLGKLYFPLLLKLCHDCFLPYPFKLFINLLLTNYKNE
jgi:hypothetical protein